jgi:hypothetical protein
MSIEEALVEIESRRFIGRRDELELLRQSVARSVLSPDAVYVWGPAGVGKTALLRAFAREVAQGGRTVLLIESGKTGQGLERILGQLAVALHAPLEPPSLPGVLSAALERLASQRGILLLIDDYDALGTDESAMRQQLLYRLPAGAAVVLAGRRPPGQLWPLERAWRRFVTQVPLGSLSPADADELLSGQGIADAAMRREAYLFTGGRPALVAQVADLLAPGQEEAVSLEMARPQSALSQEVIASYLIEQILHPGSRRRAWRTRACSDPLDRTLAAASLVPAFSRELLAAMVGQEVVDRAWARLQALPCVPAAGGWHRLEGSMRSSAADIIRHEHPWLSDVWLRRALVYCLRSDDDAPGWMKRQGMALSILAQLAAGSACRPAGRALQTRSRRGVSRTELMQLPADERLVDALADLAERRPADLLAVEDQGGSLLAAGAALRTSDLIRDGSWPAGRTDDLVVVLASRSAAASWQIVGEIAPDWCRAAAVLAEDCGAASDVFARLKFTPPEDGGGWWRLELRQRSYRAWLEEVAAAYLDSARVADHAALAKEVLQLLGADRDLGGTAAAAVFGQRCHQGGAQLIRRWVLDALDNLAADQPQADGRSLLQLYYVDGVGSHEDVADRLNLPRATYFRMYRHSLAQLGQALCGGDF